MKTLKSIYQSAKRNFTKSLSSQIKFDLDPAHSIISSKEHKSEFTLKINSDLFVYFLKEDGRIYVSAEYLGESEQEMCYLINKIFMSDGIYHDNIDQAIESVYYLLKSKGYKVLI